MQKSGRKRRFFARLAAAVGALFLIAAAVNVPVAVGALRTRLTVNKLRPMRMAEREEMVWPWCPPAVTGAWPTPNNMSIHVGPLLTYVNVHSRDNNYSMELQSAGFPLRTVAKVHMWWPDAVHTSNDPDNPPDPALQFLWPGMVLNPLLVAVGGWVVLVAPFEVFVALRWRRRVGRGLCPYCAYPVGQADVCTECGRA